MSIVDAHAALVADLSSRLSQYDVVSSPSADVPHTRGRVFVLAREARAADVACPYARLSCDVIVVSAMTDPGSRTDLHTMTDDVLAALASSPHTSWESVLFTDPFLDVNPAARIIVERNMP